MSEYKVTIKDYYGKECVVEVSLEVYQILSDEKKFEERDRYEKRKYIDGRTINDLNTLGKLRAESLEDTYINKELLKEALNVLKTCTSIQRKRFFLYRICGYTYREIAAIEGCHLVQVKKSVDAVIKKLKNLQERG